MKPVKNDSPAAYAVIAAGGTQYLVREGDTIDLFRLGRGSGELLEFDQVLLVRRDSGTLVGTPTVQNSRVVARVIEQRRGKKIRVATYRAKSRYRRVKGHRDDLTRVKIESIIVSQEGDQPAKADTRVKRGRRDSQKKISPGEKKPAGR